MLEIDKIQVFGWKSAIRGMRNPLNTWNKTDSEFGLSIEDWEIVELGINDLSLMRRLSNAGNDHSKFLRMIHVTMDILAPLYWWKEFDTYKVGTVANSCSTMHKIHEKPFSIDDFQVDNLGDGGRGIYSFNIIPFLNDNRRKFVETGDKAFWWNMIQMLPSSYKQKRTVDLNYQVLKNMYHARRNHKLDEWHTFCDIVKEQLPYFNEICIEVI